MPSSVVLAYVDPAAYAREMPGVAAELHPTAAGDFKANSTLISLGQLSLGRFADNLPRVMHAVPSSGRALLSFKTTDGPALVWDGVHMQSTAILQHADRSSYFQRSAGEASWGDISIPLELMQGSLAELAGCDATASHQTTLLTPTHTAMARLQRLHAACCALAERGPEILSSPDAARGIEQSLTGSLAACVESSSGHQQVANSRHNAQTMRRFRNFVEANADRAIYIGEISMAVGVPGRILRNCCKEYLGMGATQYLTLRRMHLVHSCLCRNSPATSTVTEAATFHGFWELGRFSVNYKALFGEQPIQTLRREQTKAMAVGESEMTNRLRAANYH